MGQPVTMRDIAERVGKSVSAVSKALGGAPDIGQETLVAVRRAAEELGYEPNAAAQQLKGQLAETVGLVLPATADLRLSDPFFSEFLAGVVESLETYGLGLRLSTVTGDDPAAAYVKQTRSRRVDGFIIVRTLLEDRRVDVVRDLGVPFVTFGRTSSVNGFPYVDEDGSRAIAEIVDYLAGLGHEHLVYLTEPIEYTKAYHRARGFTQGLSRHGIEESAESTVVAGYRQDGGYKAAAAILGRPNPPTAIVCSNDLLALGAISAARDRGLAIGKDISITGFDDIDQAAHADPPLTTVRNAAYDSGQTAADILGRKIRGEQATEDQVLVSLSVVVRDSTGPPPTKGREAVQR